MDLPKLPEEGSGKGDKTPKQKRQQQLMLAGTFALVVIAYLTYRRMKSGSSSAATAAAPVDNLAGAAGTGGGASGPAYGPTTPTQTLLSSIPGLDSGGANPAPAPAATANVPDRSLLPAYSPGTGNDWYWNYAKKVWYAAPSVWSRTHIPGVGPSPAPSTVPAAKPAAKTAAKAAPAPKPIAHPAAVAKGAHPATVSGGSNVATHAAATVPLTTPKRVVPHGAIPAAQL